MAKRTNKKRGGKNGERVRKGASYVMLSPSGHLFRAKAIMRDGRFLMMRLG